MEFNDFNSTFEKEIFDSVKEFSAHFNQVNLYEKNILEIIGIAFYGGRFITKSKSQLNSHIFEKYIQETITYYVNFLTNELTYIKFGNFYSNCDKNKINKEISNELNNYLEKEKKSKNDSTYKSILHNITTFVKEKYTNNRNDELYISNPLYKDYFVMNFININAINYVQYLIIKENLDVFSSLFSYYKNNNIITKNNVIDIVNDCISLKCESSIVMKIYEFICIVYEENNIKENVSYCDISNYIQDILKNVIKTPYYYESKYNEYFDNMLNTLSENMDKYITNEHIKLFEFIEKIKENIVQKGIDSKENIDTEYPNICITEIVNNKLNINEFTAKMFYEYFMCSKPEAQMALTLDKCIAIVQNIENK